MSRWPRARAALVLAAAVGGALPGCGGSAGPAPATGSAEEVAAAVAAEPPAAGSAPRPDCYLGVVVAGDAAEVVAEVGGRVREVAVRPGDRVETGDLLATLSPDELLYERRLERAGLAAAESLLAELEVEVKRAEQEHRRRIELGDLVSREQVEAAQFALEAAARRRDGAAAELDRARQRLARLEGDLGRAEIRAPFAGTVAARHLEPGVAVTPGTPVARLVGGGELLVRFAVPPGRSAALATGAALRVELESPRLVRRATLERIAPEIDAAAQMMFAEGRITRPDGTAGGLPAGAVVRVSPAGADARCFEASPPPLASRAEPSRMTHSTSEGTDHA